MINLMIDQQPIAVQPGTTILQAAQQLDIHIPTLCYQPEFAPSSSCQICLVAVSGRDHLVPACSALAESDMVVTTNSAKIQLARQAALALLLSEHTGDCLAPCQRACPYFINIPLVIRLIQQQQVDRAAQIMMQVTGDTIDLVCRRCQHPCETVCRRNKIDDPVAIADLMTFAGRFGQAVAPVANQQAIDIGKQKKRFSSFIRKLSSEELARTLQAANPSARSQPTGETFSLSEAMAESQRCLHCDCGKQDNCRLRDQAEALQAKPAAFYGERLPFEQVITDRYIFETGKCIKCGGCVNLSQQAGCSSGFTFLKRGFTSKIGVPFDDYANESLLAIIDQCIEKCPTGAICHNDRSAP